MWEAIAQVSSGLTLAAFIAAVVASMYKSKIDERERLIRAAKLDQRADLVRDVLEFFHVDTSGLTKEQQFTIALEQIHARAQRFRVLTVLVGFLAVIGAATAVYAIVINRSSQKCLPQGNQVKQSSSGRGSPNVNCVSGDVVITVDQSNGKTGVKETPQDQTKK